MSRPGAASQFLLLCVAVSTAVAACADGDESTGAQRKLLEKCGDVLCEPGEYCAELQDGSLMCLPEGVAAGRPFTPAGADAPVVPALADSDASDWRTTTSPQLQSPVSDAARAAVGAHWAAAAVAEFASVAAFSAHALELAAAAAPAALVTGALTAALDEVEHAKLAFGLAAEYLRNPKLAPGQLPLSSGDGGSSVQSTPTPISLAVVAARDGCVAETIAAVEAAAAHAKAKEPTVRAALGRIAEDEARHARLAWQTVEWAISVDAAAAAAVTSAIEAAIGALPPVPSAAAAAQAIPVGGGGGLYVTEAESTSVEWQLEAHGVLGAGDRAEARRHALVELIEPALALLGGGAGVVGAAEMVGQRLAARMEVSATAKAA